MITPIIPIKNDHLALPVRVIRIIFAPKPPTKAPMKLNPVPANMPSSVCRFKTIARKKTMTRENQPILHPPKKPVSKPPHHIKLNIHFLYNYL